MGKKLYKFIIIFGALFIGLSLVLQNLPMEILMPKQDNNPILLTMRDLGYDNSEESASFYGKWNYVLSLSAVPDNPMVDASGVPLVSYLTLSLIESKDEDNAVEIMNRRMIEHQAFLRRLNSGYEGVTNLYINASKDSPERIRQILTNVNADWQVDEAYLSDELWEMIWLRKGHRILEIDFSNFVFTSEKINIIKELLDIPFPQENQ